MLVRVSVKDTQGATIAEEILDCLQDGDLSDGISKTLAKARKTVDGPMWDFSIDVRAA